MPAPLRGIPWPGLFAGAAVTAADQLSKWIVSGALRRGESVEVLGGAVRLTYVQNPGGAFGLFRDSGGAFTLLSVVAVCVLLWALWKMSARARAGRFSLGIVLGGAIGNLIDRLRFEGVIDFVDVGVGDLRWPVFNVADAAVVVGVGLFLIFSFRTGGSGAEGSGTGGEDDRSHRSSGTGSDST